MSKSKVKCGRMIEFFIPLAKIPTVTHQQKKERRNDF